MTVRRQYNYYIYKKLNTDMKKRTYWYVFKKNILKNPIRYGKVASF